MFANVNLHNLVKIEDWFKDTSTIVKTLRKGKGRNPFVDSTVKLRMQVLVNDKEILSNYPKYDDEETKAAFYFETSENLKAMTSEEKKEYL